MTYLEKCLELAEDFTLKNQRYNQLNLNKKHSPADMQRAEKEKEEAKQRYISFITKFSKTDLHQTVLV